MFETLKRMIKKQTQDMKKVDAAYEEVERRTSEMIKANSEAMKRIQATQMKATC